MSETTQAATNAPNGQGTPASDGNGEQASDQQPTLEQSLERYKTETAQPAEVAPQPPQPGEQQPAPSTETQGITITPERFAAIEAADKRLQQQELKDTMSSSVAHMRSIGGDALGGMSDHMLEDALNGAATRDPRISMAYASRHRDPAGWNDVVAAVGRNAAAELANRHDPSLTADRIAARASGQGISPNTGDASNSWADDWNDITPEEQKKRMLGAGYDPRQQLP